MSPGPADPSRAARREPPAAAAAFVPAARVWLLAARPKTLLAAVSPVMVGTAMAWGDGVFHALSAVLALVGAVLIQVGTNFHNDYSDFEKGTDRPDRVGPTRVTAAGLSTVAQMRRATIAVFSLAVASGMYLMIRGGWPIVVVGFSSILFGVLYTAGRKSLAYLGIADVFVLVFFGPVAVAGTYYVQALSLHPAPVIAGFGPGLLSMAILLVNNIRDADGDAAAGKRTLVVRLGRPVGRALYALSIVGAAVVAAWVALSPEGHPASALAALVAIPGFLLWRTVSRETTGPALNPVLGRTAALGLAWSFLFSIGCLL